MAAMQGAIRSRVGNAVLAAAVFVGVASCGSKAAAPAKPAALSEGRAREEAQAVVDEVYRALKSSDTDDLLSLMSDQVLVLGPRPSDLMRSRAEVVTALEEVIDSRERWRSERGAGKWRSERGAGRWRSERGAGRWRSERGAGKSRFSSAGTKLVIGPGGRSGFAVDRLKLGAHAAVATALLDGQGPIWRVNAVSLVAPMSAAAAKKAAASGALSAPAATAQPPLPEGEAAKKALVAGIAAPAAWLGALGDDADAAIVTADGGVATGKRNLERAAKRFADIAIVATSPIASVTSGDGQLAMVTCLATKQWKTEAPRPVRLTAIFRRTSANAKADAVDSWQLAVFQEAHAVTARSP